jgi:phenylacetate-CoA ligase
MQLTTALRGRLARLADALPHSPFYSAKLARFDPDDFANWPFTTKAELVADQAANPPYGRILTCPRECYCRLHQTSGTSGLPLRWLDTRESWNWMLGNWDQMFAIIGLRPEDRLFFPFSFGPFLGFWTAFEAAVRAGNFCLPAGGLSSGARLKLVIDNEITVVFCTPTYALHLADVARKDKIDLPGSSVRAVVVAGEPGGSIPATRALIERGWGARVFDHSGMTEIGPAAIECPEGPGGLHVLEDDFLVEVIDPAGAEPVPIGSIGELVLTNLGRLGSPLVRYRTGDLVKVDPQPCPCGSRFVRLEGGILGRCDDMIHLRGNNVYPNALEALLRRFPEVAEFRVEIDETASLPRLCIEIEPVAHAPGDLLGQLDRAIRDELLFRAELRFVHNLPRFEMKTKRFHHRAAPSTKGEEP